MTEFTPNNRTLLPTGFKPIDGNFKVDIDLTFDNPTYVTIIPRSKKHQIIIDLESIDGDLGDYDQRELLTCLVRQCAYKIKNQLFREKIENSNTKEEN